MTSRNNTALLQNTCGSRGRPSCDIEAIYGPSGSKLAADHVQLALSVVCVLELESQMQIIGSYDLANGVAYFTD